MHANKRAAAGAVRSLQSTLPLFWGWIMKVIRFPMLAAVTSIFSAALLAGCASVAVTMAEEGAAGSGTGVVHQGFVQPHRIEMTLEGQVYTGEWRSQPAPDHPLATSYLHRHTVGRVIATLSNSQGQHLYCNWLVDSLHGDGFCEDDRHRKFKVTIG